MVSLGHSAASTPGADRSSGVVVVGMHRSGTSLATSLVSALGFVAAGDMMEPLDDNPKGFWEHQGVVDTHDEFLRRLGRTWSDPTPLPADAFTGDDAAWARKELRGHLERDLLPQPRWVLKDPRLCRLLPLWMPLLDRPELSVRYLLVLRSPAAVVNSLERRNALAPRHSQLLWLDHVLEAEHHTRHSPRGWFDFDRFILSPEETCGELAAWLSPEEARPQAATKSVLDQVYDRNLVHYSSASEDGVPDDGAGPWISETYATLALLAGPEAEDFPCLETLDRLHSELDRAGRFLDHPTDRSRLRAERDQARQERDRARQERDRTRQERDRTRQECDRTRQEYQAAQSRIGSLRHRNQRLEATLAEVFASRSWRWTKPFRRNR